MTFRERLAKEHPDAIDSTQYGGCVNCPCSYGYESRYTQTLCDGNLPSETVCTQCWNREIPDTEETKTPAKIADDIADVYHKLIDRGIPKGTAINMTQNLISRGYFDKCE